MALSAESSHWVFDYIVEVFNSPAWEVPIMTFIDENCEVFDNEDENKFIYTDIHERFREIVDSLLTQHLAELGMTNEDFVEACANIDPAHLGSKPRQRSRSGSGDENMIEGEGEERTGEGGLEAEVVEQLMAMDDFVSFKAMMRRRNMELEIEAVKALKEMRRKKNGEHRNRRRGQEEDEEEDDEEDEEEEEERDLPAYEMLEIGAEEGLCELELLHLEEQMEQLELERAIALSLSIDEVALQQIRRQEKLSVDPTADGEADGDSDRDEEMRSKAHDSERAEAESDSKTSIRPASPSSHKQSKPSSGSSKSRPKPARRPPSRAEMEALVAERRKAAAEAQKMKQEVKKEQKLAQKEFKTKAQVSKEEMERRSRYLKEQRDAILDKKKKEREQTLKDYTSSRSRTNFTPPAHIAQEISMSAGAKTGQAMSDESSAQERQRMALGIALATQMRQDLYFSQVIGAGGIGSQEGVSFNAGLKAAERLRMDNKMREEQFLRSLA